MFATMGVPFSSMHGEPVKAGERAGGDDRQKRQLERSVRRSALRQELPKDRYVTGRLPAGRLSADR